MDFLKEINDATIIAPSNLKYKILKEIDKQKTLKNIKIYSLEEIKENYYFKILPRAKFYISKKFNLKLDIVKKLLKNLYYIDNSNNENMILLRQIKEELVKENLIKETKKINLNNIYVVGYDALTKEEKSILKNYKEINYKKYEMEESFEFDEIETEVIFIFEKIMELLEKGIKLENIILTNVSDEYKIPLMIIGKRYNLNLNLKENYYYSTINYKNTKEKILNNQEIEITKENKKLIDKINKLDDFNKNDLEEILDEYAKEIKLTEENDIRIENLTDNFFNDDEYVFILNATKSNLPKVYKDEDYLYDQIKPSILENTIEKNKLEELKTINALKKIKNKIITLKKEANGIIYLPSSILRDIRHINLNYSNYSNKENKIKLIELLDKKEKYGETSEITTILENSYENNYKNYDSSFKKIDLDTFYKTINNKMILSYSSLNEFYECSFKFYLNRILKLNPYQETFMTYIGSLFHAILEKNPDSISEFSNTYIKEHPYNFSKKEEFFLNKVLKDIPIITNYIKEFENKTELKTKKTEQKYFYKIESKLNITLMGIIDKLYMNDKSFVLVDYKTGDTKIHLNDTIHGLSMQLPIYALLVSKNEEKNLIGFFLQNILETKFNHDDKKTVLEQKENSLKLNGYMIDDVDEIKAFDPTYQDSKFISSMKTSSKGFYAYTKILSKQKEENLISLAEKKVKEMAKDIENAQFDINPKKLKGENISCKFCIFKDICFNKDTKIILKEEKDLSFLGGEA